MPDAGDYVPLAVLEVLDAAQPGGLPPGRVEATGVWLYAQGLLGSRDQLLVGPPNGEHARSHQLLDGLFTAVGAGMVRRSGGRYVLTPRGEAALQDAGMQAGDAARAAALDLSDKNVEDVRTEADEALRAA